jgi:hypothetical protein
MVSLPYLVPHLAQLVPPPCALQVQLALGHSQWVQHKQGPQLQELAPLRRQNTQKVHQKAGSSVSEKRTPVLLEPAPLWRPRARQQPVLAP